MYRPTMSRTFSTKNGSAESLKVPDRWGLSSKACQMRHTAFWVQPHLPGHGPGAPVMSRPTGSVSSRARQSHLQRPSRRSILRGEVRDGARLRDPDSRCSRKRSLHLPTVTADTPSSSATGTCCSAQHREARHPRPQCQPFCELFGRRAHVSVASRSSSPLISRGFLGLPVSHGSHPRTPGMEPASAYHHHLYNALTDQDTRSTFDSPTSPPCAGSEGVNQHLRGHAIAAMSNSRVIAFFPSMLRYFSTSAIILRRGQRCKPKGRGSLWTSTRLGAAATEGEWQRSRRCQHEAVLPHCDREGIGWPYEASTVLATQPEQPSTLICGS